MVITKRCRHAAIISVDITRGILKTKQAFFCAMCSPRRKQRQIVEIRHLGNEERALCVYLWILYLLYFYFVRVDSFFPLMYLQVYCSVYL